MDLWWEYYGKWKAGKLAGRLLMKWPKWHKNQERVGRRKGKYLQVSSIKVGNRDMKLLGSRYGWQIHAYMWVSKYEDWIHNIKIRCRTRRFIDFRGGKTHNWIFLLSLKLYSEDWCFSMCAKIQVCRKDNSCANVMSCLLKDLILSSGGNGLCWLLCLVWCHMSDACCVEFFHFKWKIKNLFRTFFSQFCL